MRRRFHLATLACLATLVCFAAGASAGPAGAASARPGADAFCAAGTGAGCRTLVPTVPVPAPALPQAPASPKVVPAPSTPPAPAAPDASLPCPGQDQTPTPSTLAAARIATRCLINRERRSRGLGAVSSVGTLTTVATAYAGRMAREDFFDHVAPDGSTTLARIDRTGYLGGSVRTWAIGENLGWGTGRLATPESIVTAWMQSPHHRRNLLDPEYTELGLGIAVGAPKSGLSDGSAATYVNEFGARTR